MGRRLFENAAENEAREDRNDHAQREIADVSNVVLEAVKCRGPEYLRIIYGPEYAAPENLERLRSRGVSTKRSLALRKFAPGIEGLDRFVRGERLRRAHECVLGVLALESEPVDPSL